MPILEIVFSAMVFSSPRELCEAGTREEGVRSQRQPCGF